MKKNFSFITVSAALIVALCGCSSDVEGPRQGEIQQVIAFTPMEIKAIRGVSATRGSQVGKNDITSYGVSSSIYPAGNSYTSVGCGSYWFNEEIMAASGESDHYWPGSTYNVSFFAYAPYGATGLALGSKNDLGYPRYTYVVPSAIANQCDFITADVLNHSGVGTTTPVPLTFHHRCADIRFCVHNRGTSAITVHSIGLYGLKYTGTYCESSLPKWTLSGSANSTSLNPFLLSLGTSVAGGATIDATGTTNHFIMLPQTVASGTQIYDVDATVNGNRQHYYHTLPSAFEIQAGKVYTVTLTLGELTMEVDTDTDIQDWAEEVKYLTVSGMSSNSTWTQPSVTGGENTTIADWTEEE